MADVKKKKKKITTNISVGDAHIFATFNNTHVVITDKQGNAIVGSSSGNLGIKGSKKNTPYAAGLSAETVGKKAVEAGIKSVDVIVKGPGHGRESAVRSLQTAGLEVLSIKDVSPVAHNGCRPPKRRRK